MDLVNRLKLFLEKRQIAISQFADTCRIPRPTVSQILNGRNKKISDELISKIHEAYPDLSVLWLMFGEGEMMSAENTRFSEPQNGPVSPQTATQTPIEQQHIPGELDFGNDTPDDAEKFPDLFSAAMDAHEPKSSPKLPNPTIVTPKKGSTSITFDPDTFKKITNIVVFYSDNSFESFLPSPQ